MAHLPTSMRDFTLHQHPIILHDDTNNPKYLCERCMTYGFGARYHCHSCTFNLHEYCATCPQTLLSFMHPCPHSLKLVERDHHLGGRTCNICCDFIEGLSYRCEICRFNVHPICSQLSETLNHILHQEHPLRLMAWTKSGTCAVCRGACDASSWRYRCALCEFDIHIDCVLIQCEKRVTTDRGISTYVPPSRFSGYTYGIPPVPPSTFPQQHHFGGYNPSPNHFPGPSNIMQHYNHNMPQPYQQIHFAGYNPSPNHFPGPSNMYHYNHNMLQPYQQYQGHGQAHHYNFNMPQPYQQHQGHGQAQTHHGGRIGKVMFNVVKAITAGVISNVIFGVDLSSFFPF